MSTVLACRLGRQTAKLRQPVTIRSWAAVAGSMEGQGRLGSGFDEIMADDLMGGKSFEDAEVRILVGAVQKALGKVGRSPGDVDRLFAGDLLDQIVTSNFAAEQLGIPFYGVYGACSTSAETLSLAAMAVDGGYCDMTMAATASHHLAAERQYRYPVELGVQRPPTSQWTATGSAAFLLDRSGEGPGITHVTAGIVRQLGVKDPNNMGAAMAPAAAGTIWAHLEETGRSPEDYDLILTGDLGKVGREMTLTLLRDEGVQLKEESFLDSGLLLYEANAAEVLSGGSGAACSALVLAAHALPEMLKGRIRRLLLVATGSLHSPKTFQQGLPIPGVAHAVAIEGGNGR